jgi:multidrug resistance efflux pump
VKLNENEKAGLEKSFLRKSIGAILLSLLLFLVIAGLLYQNLRYKYERVGMVESNYKTIYPNNEGIIEKVYFNVGDKVKKGDVLADLNSDKIFYKLKLLDSIKNARIKEKHMQSTFQKKADIVIDDNELLTLKKQIVKDRNKDLQNAKIQFKNHLITKSDFMSIKNSYLEAKERYAYYKKQSQYQKNSNLPPLPKVINIEEVELKISNQKRLLEEFRVSSPLDGKVYEINVESGDRVGKNDSILTLWTKDKPQIIVTLSSYKAVDLKIGDEVEIVDALENQKFTGVVRHINDSSFDTDFKIATTKKANEVFIAIEPEDSAKVLAPHSMVNVLFKRKFGF